MKTERVELGSRSYDITIGQGLLKTVGAVTRQTAGGSSSIVITDSNVGPLYAQTVVESLRANHYAAHVVTFAAGEPNKTLATASDLFDEIFALPAPVDRNTVVVALGGGVVGDMAGFVAAILLRGVSFVQVPTTLLADVDSSVGGKTGVDHWAGKNLIGAFHQPRAVVIDTDALASLAPVELESGLAECVKHGIIRDVDLFGWIEHSAAGLLGGEPPLLEELIARNVAIKAAVVAADERESGERAHLNFGHTLGHAIEAELGMSANGGEYSRHGHCVSLGMVAAGHIAASRGLLSAGEFRRIEALLASLGLPVRRGGLDVARLVRTMRHDKKAKGGLIRFVLPAGRLGAVDVFDDVSDDEISAGVRYLAPSITVS